MKQPRDAAALAASLTNAANAPLPLPERATASVISMPQRTETPPQTEALPPKKAAKIKIMSDTVGMTLRPSRELLNDYTVAAAERTKAKGRVVSAQEMMLEVLERGRPKVQK
jgi:hypothetical protein